MGWIVGTTGCHACEERTDITFFTSGTVQILLLILGNENFISHMLHITCILLLFHSGFFFLTFMFFFFLSR
jgi:hypothetical protein